MSWYNRNRVDEGTGKNKMVLKEETAKNEIGLKELENW